MAMRDLVSWNRGRDLDVRGRETVNPFLTLHREMNRLFDDAFRGFDLAPFGGDGASEPSWGWPNIEVADSGKEIKVTAELPGLKEKEIDVRLANGALIISGERRSELEDKDRLFSERYYGRFERRIPLADVDEDKVSAHFKNGVLTVQLPKSPGAAEKVKQIAVKPE